VLTTSVWQYSEAQQLSGLWVLSVGTIAFWDPSRTHFQHMHTLSLIHSLTHSLNLAQDRLSKIEREAGKQHGFLSNVEKLAAAAAADPTKRAPTTSGISR
jgi:hypothetical protein